MLSPKIFKFQLNLLAIIRLLNHTEDKCTKIKRKMKDQDQKLLLRQNQDKKLFSIIFTYARAETVYCFPLKL